MSRRKKRHSLGGSKWRVCGPLEKAIAKKALRAADKGSPHIGFFGGMMLCASISVRQKWFLAFLASKSDVEWSEHETEWINDVLSQECPEGFPQKVPYWQKPAAASDPILQPARKVRG